MRVLIVLVFLSLAAILLPASFARAQTFTLVPAHPMSTDVVQVRIDIEVCDPITGTATVDVPGQRVLVHVSSSDACDISNPAHTTTPRFITIGQLPPGQYAVDYETCPFPPPPGGPCVIFRTEQLVVTGVSAMRFTVPGLSQWGLLGLMTVMLACGLRTRRRV